MSVELKIPEIGESIAEVVIGEWLKSEGEYVQKDEDVVVVESDKATVEVTAPQAGRLAKILRRSGESAKVGEAIGRLESADAPEPDAPRRTEAGGTGNGGKSEAAEAAEETAAEATGEESREMPESEAPATPTPSEAAPGDDAAEGRAEEAQPNDAPGEATDRRSRGAPKVESEPRPVAERPIIIGNRRPEGRGGETREPPPAPGPERQENAVAMTPIRQRIAKKLVEAQQTTAFLSTFNEIEMTAVQELRSRYQDAFQEKHGVKLGFMSFFVRAAVDALKAFPEINARIRGSDIVYHNYHDIGIAVGGGKGLVVPVLRSADRLGFSEIESAIQEFARKAANNQLRPEDLEGGTFTISNGGVYGSLLSTPILNAPQSGILGMHAIEDRPVARRRRVVIRPMMYVALTYDHRIVDGREAVLFLRRIKECIEAPARLLLDA